MATIRLRVGLAGVDFALASGDLYTCPDEVAARFVAAGQADLVDPPSGASPPSASPLVETMVEGPSERAARIKAPAPRKGRG